MTRSYLFLVLVSTSAASGQITCPAINFAGPQTIDLHPSSGSHLDLIREADRSLTAFEISDADPSFVVQTTPHFENQIGRCLPAGTLKSGSAQSGALPLLSGALVAAPAAIAPGKIFVVDVAANGSSVPFYILGSQHTVISSGALNMPGTQPGNIVGIAEVTGDGKLDVIVRASNLPLSGAPSSSLWIFPGNGDGTFGNGIQQMLPSTASMAGFDVADVNGDGLPDVVFADIADQKLILGLGQAGTQFSFQTVPLPLSFLFSIAGFRIADLNGDHRGDLVFSGSDSTGAGTVAVMLGDGKGGFSAPAISGPFRNFGGPMFLSQLAIGDLNGDGIPDIATQTGTVLFGDGKGGFARYDQYAMSGTSVVTITDVNDDGINDVVFGSGTADFVPGSRYTPSVVTVLFGLGSGKFFAAPVTSTGLNAVPSSSVSISTQMAAGDFDGDGKSEVAVFNAVSSTANSSTANSSEVALTVMKAAGDGGLSTVAQSSAPHAAGFRAVTALSGDFNHDGMQDLLLLLRFDSGGGEIEFYRGRGNNTFDAAVTTPLTEQTDFMIATDLNGDGVPDIAGTAGNLVWVRAGKGDGTFGSITFSSTPSSPNGPPNIAFGDFTGDGKPDLAIASSDQKLAVLPGKGDGTFAAPITSAITGGFPGLSQSVFATADLNGDGFLDIFLQTAQSADIITVMLGNGDGTFHGYNPELPAGTPTNNVAVADFNRDGVPDLIANFSYRGSARPYALFAGDGDGSFGPAIQGPPSGSLIIADVNGDGFPDLLESNGYGLTTFLNISAAPALLTIVSGATFMAGPLAADSFASVFGVHLAAPTSTTASVSVQDAAGMVRSAAVTYTSPEQINFIVPAGTAPGPATVILGNTNSRPAPPSAPITVNAIAPALFTVPNLFSPAAPSVLSIAAAYAIRVDPQGNQTFLSLFDSSGAVIPIDLTQPGDVYISLYGTGFDAAAAGSTTASIEGVPARVTYAGPAPQLPGVDQINLLVPASLAGKGIVFVYISIGGLAANSVILPIR